MDAHSDGIQGEDDVQEHHSVSIGEGSRRGTTTGMNEGVQGYEHHDEYLVGGAE
jgi:hypothetical protein